MIFLFNAKRYDFLIIPDHYIDYDDRRKDEYAFYKLEDMTSFSLFRNFNMTTLEFVFYARYSILEHGDGILKYRNIPYFVARKYCS